MLPQDYKKVLTLNGETFTVKIAPCCWMYNHCFRICIQKQDGANVYVDDPMTTYPAATEETVGKLLATVKVVKCKNGGCSKTQFVDPTSNRNGECEECFTKTLAKEFGKDQDQEIAKRDRAMKRKGVKWKVVVWIHAGGDDRCEDWYLQGDEKPSDKMIQAKLKKRRSRVLTDYTIIKL